jgi:ATP-dependent helicase YprA (DUF1998 family)
MCSPSRLPVQVKRWRPFSTPWTSFIVKVTPPLRRPSREKTTRILYISPIKALGSDIQRNLQIPLQGISEQRKKHGAPEVAIRVAMRTGDTSSQERATLVRHPPDILITTPESLYLMLTSRARETLRGVETVIVDEVHAVAGNKRGAHLALSLERLDALLARPAQRIGLSATVRSPGEVAQFLGAIVRLPWSTHRPFAIRIFVLWCPLPISMTSSPPVPEPGNQPRGQRRLHLAAYRIRYPRPGTQPQLDHCVYQLPRSCGKTDCPAQ